jgi:hypothetical protein
MFAPIHAGATKGTTQRVVPSDLNPETTIADRTNEFDIEMSMPGDAGNNGGKKKTKDVILDKIDQELSEIEEDRRFGLCRLFLIATCSCSTLAGVFVIVFALGTPPVFTSFGLNRNLLYSSIIFFIPLFIWLRRRFCPSKSYREYRDRVLKLRRQRRRMEERRQDYYYNGHIYRQREREEWERKHEQARLEMGF